MVSIGSIGFHGFPLVFAYWAAQPAEHATVLRVLGPRGSP